MPLYEYQCEACDRRFELIRKFSDPPLETCPTCGGAVHKLMSTPAFQFKGTGWYVTDYAKKTAPSDGDDSKAEATGKETTTGETGEKTEKPKQAEKTDKVEKTGKADVAAKSAKGEPSSSAATPQKSGE